MTAPLEFTGERFVPGIAGEIAHEHWHRYAFARRFAAGRRVLDVACGEGYGSAALADVAPEVTGVDVDAAAVAHARDAYAGWRNLRFVEGSATSLPLPDASVDVVVSFETIEHLPAADQPRMIVEFARVLAPGGLVVLSSPNRPEYSDARNYSNPFHLHELDRDELARLLDPSFPAQRWYRQRRYVGSALWSEGDAPGVESWRGDERGVGAATPPPATYFVVVAARDAAALPPAGPGVSLLTDADDREWRRLDGQAREVLRLDALLKDRDAALDRQTHHIHHLERLVAERDRAIEARDASVASLRSALEYEQRRLAEAAAERERLERAIAAQERIIAYRQSARWWLRLPFLRMRLAWNRLRGK